MYKLQNNSVKRLSDGASIPFANGNMDYEAYKQWLSEGNTPEPEFTEAELVQQELDKQIIEAKKHLSDTDFKMTVDYFATMTEEQQTAITTSRAEARAFLKANGY